LIELIGVLAIMGILASMTVPPIIRQIRQAQTANEDANLNEVARAIVEGIKATGTIPNPNIVPSNPGGWVNVAYNYTTLTDDIAPSGGFAPGTLHYVFPSETAFADTARRIYLDPTFLNYLNDLLVGVAGTFATPAGGWPATTPGGVIFPNQAIRLYIVSSSRPDFVLSCSANGPNVQVAGNNYGNPAGAPLIDQLSSWVKAAVSTTGFIQAPGTAVENWANNAHQYLHVKTVDLRPLFCKVTLRDLASPPTADVNTVGAHLYPATAGDPVDGTALGYSFNFVPSGGLGTAFTGAEVGTLTSSLNQRILIDRTTGLTGFNVRDNNSVPAGSSQFDLTLPLSPQYEINSLGIQPFPVVIPPDINSSSFYLIKETVIKLYDENVATPTLLLNMPVTTDMNFEYFNGSWTRVD
jgi:type II secretory pathway pseudopilin PulG